MRKIKVTLDIGLMGCRKETVLEVEEDDTDEDIDELAHEWAMQKVNIVWKEQN